MSFGESITTCFGKYADFTGRASRAEFWWFYLFILVVNVLLYLTWVSALADPDPDNLPAGAFLSLIFGLATLLPLLAAMTRRLHDTGRSGGYIFVALVPFVGSIILIVWLASLGTPATNRYGEPPPA